MKPGKPGIWASSIGALVEVVADYSNGKLTARVLDGTPRGCFNLLYTVENLPGDDWLPVEMPKFPLSPKPKLCLARFEDGPPMWYTGGESYVSTLSPFALCWGKYEVVPHPDNDPEAVRLIEEAKR